MNDTKYELRHTVIQRSARWAVRSDQNSSRLSSATYLRYPEMSSGIYCVGGGDLPSKYSVPVQVCSAGVDVDGCLGECSPCTSAQG